MSQDKINIIIPVYNPHAEWEKHLVEYMGRLEKIMADVDFRVMLVNDGSTRAFMDLEKILKAFPRLNYYAYPVNKGKGYAIRYGIAKEEADFYFYTDADFPYGEEIIAEAYKKLKNDGVNLVVGIRDKKYFHSLPPERRFLSFLMKGFCRIISRSKLKDTQAPLKGMDNKAREIFLNTKIDGFIFDFEFLYQCMKHKITFTDINLTPRPGLIFTEFSQRTIRKEFINLIKAVI